MGEKETEMNTCFLLVLGVKNPFFHRFRLVQRNEFHFEFGAAGFEIYQNRRPNTKFAFRFWPLVEAMEATRSGNSDLDSFDTSLHRLLHWVSIGARFHPKTMDDA